MTKFVVHRDDVTPAVRGVAPVTGLWADLGRAVGTVTCGVRRIQVKPGNRTTPVHMEASDEEFFYVLGGGGLSWQDGTTYEVRPGDTILHRKREEAHTLVAGPEGLDVLAYGTRYWKGGGLLPRAGIAWHYPSWVEVGAGDDPWVREIAAGELPLPAPSPRKATIRNLDEVEQTQRTNGGDCDWLQRDLGSACGSVETGLRHFVVAPGQLGPPPHCHSGEEEIFIILSGEGTLWLGDERIPVRAGHMVARPAATRVAHAFAAGAEGLELLAYGTRDGNDMVFYPRSGKIAFRGVGVIGRIERLDYWDGEA